MSTPVGAVAEDEFAENDRIAQGLFRIVVGRRHAVDAQKSKEPVVIAFGVNNEPLAQVFGLRMVARRFADGFKRGVKTFSCSGKWPRSCRTGGDNAVGPPMAGLASGPFIWFGSVEVACAYLAKLRLPNTPLAEPNLRIDTRFAFPIAFRAEFRLFAESSG